MPVLADLLDPEVKLLVCGSTAGDRSAESPVHHVGSASQFWDMLYRFGATPRVLKPAEFLRLQDYGIALADLAKDASGDDPDSPASAAGPAGLRARIEQAQPLVLAFNGKRAAQLFLGRAPAYGYQPGCDIGRTRLHVAPSTAGVARGSWSDRIWQDVMAAAGLHTVAIATPRAASSRDPSTRTADGDASVRRPAARDVEHRAGGKAALAARQPGDQRRHLLHRAESSHRDF